jgi:hypothetical protein
LQFYRPGLLTEMTKLLLMGCAAQSAAGRGT